MIFTIHFGGFPTHWLVEEDEDNNVDDDGTPIFVLAKNGERTVKLCVVCVCFLLGMDPPTHKIEKDTFHMFLVFCWREKRCLYTILYPYLKNKTSFLRGGLMFFLTP